MKAELYQTLARLIEARTNCENSGNTEWEQKHQARIDELVKDYMPSGSGIDNGVELDDSSTGEKLVFTLSFHHMNDGGYYDGWTDHKVIATPSLGHDFKLKITGKDRNQIKEYLYDTLNAALSQEVNDGASVKEAA